MKEIVDSWGRKVLLHIWSLSFFTFSLSLRLASGSLFQDTKTPRGRFTVSGGGGLTVGGHTVARITQRQVQIRSGGVWRSIQGCAGGRLKGAAPSRREEVTTVVSLGTERAGKVRHKGRLGESLAQRQANLIWAWQESESAAPPPGHCFFSRWGVG